MESIKKQDVVLMITELEKYNKFFINKSLLTYIKIMPKKGWLTKNSKIITDVPLNICEVNRFTEIYSH